jgi:LCP family protein required for cell wall assembly
MGYGGMGHDGALLTDSMIVVIVDPARKSLTLLSFPRDAWVPLAFDGKATTYNKINTAFALAADDTLYPGRSTRYTGGQGPGTFTMDTVSRLIGVPIRYYLALDFQGFRDMIDAVGGIDVDVPTAFAARYPANDDPTVDASWTTVRFVEGTQHLNGERAIEYARARETIDNPDEGTDFARSRRQRLIIQAFKARLFEPSGMVHLPQLLGIASKHVDTNYAIPDLAMLSQLALDWKDVSFFQTALTTDNYLEDGTGPQGTYIVVPSSPDHSWAQIRAFARRLWSDPAAGVAMSNTSIVVENDTGTPGVAGRVTEALRQMGYQVEDPTTGSTRATTEIVDQSDGKGTPAIQLLESDLALDNVAITEGTPNDAGQIVVELGADQSDLMVTPSLDRTAPFSLFGVLRFGVWSSDLTIPFVDSIAPVGTGRATPTPARGIPLTPVTTHGTPHSSPTTTVRPPVRMTPIGSSQGNALIGAPPRVKITP